MTAEPLSMFGVWAVDLAAPAGDDLRPDLAEWLRTPLSLSAGEREVARRSLPDLPLIPSSRFEDGVPAVTEAAARADVDVAARADLAERLRADLSARDGLYRAAAHGQSAIPGSGATT